MPKNWNCFQLKCKHKLLLNQKLCSSSRGQLSLTSQTFSKLWNQSPLSQRTEEIEIRKEMLAVHIVWWVYQASFEEQSRFLQERDPKSWPLHLMQDPTKHAATFTASLVPGIRKYSSNSELLRKKLPSCTALERCTAK